MVKYSKKKKKGRGNFFAERSTSKKKSSIKQSNRSKKKYKQQMREKVTLEKAKIDEELKSRQEFIKSIKNITKDYKTSTPESVYLLLEKLGSKDLVEKIIQNIEEINNNLDTRLNSILIAIKDIESEEPGLYEIDGYISEIKEIVKTVDMDEKSKLIKIILDDLEMVFETELQRMETGYQNDIILERVERLLNEI